MKVIAAILFGLMVFERLRSTFRSPSAINLPVQRSDRAFTLFMIVFYTVLSVAAFLDYISKESGGGIFLCVGFVAYSFFMLIRNDAIAALGAQWNSYIDAKAVKQLVAQGVYGVGRHPYYLATCGEVLSILVMFQAWRLFLPYLFLFVPLVIARVFLEEKNISEKFKTEYSLYKKIVPIIASPILLFKETTLFVRLKQVLEVCRRFGISQMIRIKDMGEVVTRHSRGYALSRITGSLIEIGVIDQLQTQHKVSLSAVSKNGDYDRDTLETLMDYYTVLGFLNKQEEVYSLTKLGRRYLESAKGATTLLYAYMPVFEALPQIIKKEKKYGVDVHRRDEYVGKGSSWLAKLLPFPQSIALLKEYKLHKILDLGCGAGEFLVDCCSVQQEFSGYGIDISDETLAVARGNAARRGVGDRALFVRGDIHAFEKIALQCSEIEVITSMFVMHEFLPKGFESVLEILRNIKKAFPGRFILICEVCKSSMEQLRRMPNALVEHHLFHRLSRQGLATIQEWRSIFSSAGLTLVTEKRLDIAGQAYFLLRA